VAGFEHRLEGANRLAVIHYSMPHYKFRAHDGAGAEKLGSAVLADDDEALAFGKRVIQEMMRSNAGLYASWKIEINEGGRNVASILFETGDGNQC
jgi:hypothetical protein